MEYIGKIAKLLIENHRKNRAMERIELKSALSIQMVQLNKLLYKTQDFLSMMGLEMVGVSPTEIVPIDEGKKLFLRKINLEDPKKVKISPSLDDKRLFTILSAIQLENNHLYEEKLKDIQNCKYFRGIDLIQFMTSLKVVGYITNNKENEIVFWSVGWRFYVEHCDSFDVFEYFGHGSS